MAIPFALIKDLMSKAGLDQFEVMNEDEYEGDLLAGFSTETGDSDHPTLTAGFWVSLQEKGEFLQARVVQVVNREKVLASEHRLAFCEYLLKQNYEKKIGRWCVDFNDGDVYLDWAIPLQNNATLTDQQFFRIVHSLVACAKDCHATMMRILETGAERNLSSSELKNEILLALTKASRYDLMSLLANINAPGKLQKALNAVQARKFDDVAALLK